MTEEYYRKVYNLKLECLAVWDDFIGLGDTQEQICWTENRIFEGREIAEAEGEKFIREMKSLLYDKEGRMISGGISAILNKLKIDKPVLPAESWTNGKIEYWPADTYKFKYRLEDAFERLSKFL